MAKFFSYIFLFFIVIPLCVHAQSYTDSSIIRKNKIKTCFVTRVSYNQEQKAIDSSRSYYYYNKNGDYDSTLYFDEEGICSDRRVHEFYPGGGLRFAMEITTHYPATQFKTFYTKKGKVEKHYQVRSPNDTVSFYFSVFDSLGLVAEQIFFQKKTKLEKWKRISYTWDKNENCVEEKAESFDGRPPLTTRKTYNEKGELIKTEIFSGKDIPGSVTLYESKENGRIQEITTYDKDLKLLALRKEVFDSLGRRILFMSTKTGEYSNIDSTEYGKNYEKSAGVFTRNESKETTKYIKRYYKDGTSESDNSGTEINYSDKLHPKKTTWRYLKGFDAAGNSVWGKSFSNGKLTEVAKYLGADKPVRYQDRILTDIIYDGGKDTLEYFEYKYDLNQVILSEKRVSWGEEDKKIKGRQRKVWRRKEEITKYSYTYYE